MSPKPNIHIKRYNAVTAAILQNLLSERRKKSLVHKTSCYALFREGTLQLKANSVEKACVLKALHFLILKAIETQQQQMV